MSGRARLAGIASLALAATAAAAGTGLVNPSFEAPGGLPDGWTLAVGAKSGDGAESAVAVDREVAHEGGASLRFSGDARTGTWRMAQQEVAVRAGDRVTLRVAARCRDLVRKGSQFPNANGVLSFLDEQGARKAIVGTPVLSGTRDWTELVADAIAPAGTTRAVAGVFSSMTGTVWFDDVRLDAGPATADDAAGRERAFDALAGHLRRTYPFFGMAGRPAADTLFSKFRKDCAGAKDGADLLTSVHAMLAGLNDVHVSVETAQRRQPTAKPDLRPLNMNLSAVQAALTERTAYERNVVLAGRIGAGGDAIGYVAIASFQVDDTAFAKVIAALDALADSKALILDVRANSGGDEKLAARIAGRFTDRDVVYARSAWRDPLSAETNAFTAPLDRVLCPVTAGSKDARRVVVLQGPYCVSSTEGFLAMMRALPNVTTIGQVSRGASGNPAPFDLLPGVKVWTSRWRSLLPDGTCIEGKGIAPAIVVEGSHAKSDPTLERALAELR